MSGIGGIYFGRTYPNFAPATSNLAKKLEFCGPDKTLVYKSDTVSLCHTLLRTSHASVQTRIDYPEMGLAIVSDARLDNRDDLRRRLNMKEDPRTTSDADVLVKAYATWGENTPKHLLGDYAFIIFDSERDLIFGARDAIGMRPLYYWLAPGNDAIAFASDSNALSELPIIPRRLNEQRVADVLENLEGADFQSTFFEGIYRLPPAHSFTFSEQEFRMVCYWQPKAGPTLQLASDDDYAKAFLDVFKEAVGCRLIADKSVGLMLSGGVDSNSIAAVAERILEEDGRRLTTLSAVGPDPTTCAETAMIRRSLGTRDVDAHLIDYSDLSRLLPELTHFTENSLEPFDASSVHNRALFVAANKLGIRVVLDGAAGDTVMHPGNRVASLLSRARFIEAWREQRLEDRFFGHRGWARRAT